MAGMRKFSIKRSFGVELEVSNLGNTIWSSLGKTDFFVTLDYLENIVSLNTTRKVTAMNDWAQSINNDFWHIKYDATCGELGKGPGFPRGWEVASFKASSYEDLLHIADMSNILAKNGIRVNNYCGLHIHADIADFNTNQAAVLVARWIKAEQWIKQAVPKHRRRNKYCRFLTSKKKYQQDFYYKPEDFWKIIKPTNFNPHENGQKKVTLNLVNYTEFKAHSWHGINRPTIELRLPEGTLDGQEIIHWVIFYLYFIEMAKHANMPTNMQPEAKLENALCYLGLNGTAPFQRETRNWFLNRIINLGTPAFSNKVKKWLNAEEEEKLDI